MALLKPEYLAGETYPALRDRVVLSHGGVVQQGAWDDLDFKVTPASGMTVDVGIGYALVTANQSGNQGIYHVENTAATGTVTAAHATLPRVDRVILKINDPATDVGLGTSTPAIQVLAGSATSGANLDNRTGAQSIPTGALLLADILVPAASSSILAANVRDRRTAARGTFFRAIATSGSIAISALSPTPVWTSELRRRFEVASSSVPVEISIMYDGTGSASNTYLGIDIEEVRDGVTLAVIESVAMAGNWHSTVQQGFSRRWVLGMTPGSSLIYPAFYVNANNVTVSAVASAPVLFTVRELLRQDLTNNGIT